VPALLLMQAGANLAGSMMHSSFALVLQQQYHLTSRQNGLVLSWVGVCVVIGALVGCVVVVFGEDRRGGGGSRHCTWLGACRWVRAL
jgi:hypothetical protein